MPRRKTTTERGLGYRHQKQRERLLALHIDGTPCSWCAQPMFKTQELDADHSQARSKGGRVADRLLHASCNRQRGDGSRDANPPTDDRAQWCVLKWQ